MELNRTSWLARFAYSVGPKSHWVGGPVSGHRSKMPETTTLCAFFWRAFVFVPLFWAFMSAILPTLAYLVYRDPVPFAVVGGIMASVLLCIWLTAFLCELLEDKGSGWANAIESTTFVQGVKAIKGKFCPIIRLK